MSSNSPLKVAIIGAGPAGLGAAIALSQYTHATWHIYEKKPEIGEISNGLTIQPTTWRMLEHFGADGHIHADDFFRDGHTQHRDGLTGVLISTSDVGHPVPPHQESCRIHRAKLQSALRRQVQGKHISVGRKLVTIDPLPSGKLRIRFDDGFTDEVDLLIGADGIRSVVRQFAFPEHNISYTGSTAYRTLVRASDVARINGLPRAVIFWHGPGGKWVYTCPLDNDDWEVTCSIKQEAQGSSSWGRKADVGHFVALFSDMCAPVRRVLELVTYVEQYDYFAGTRLESIVSGGNVALIGDASHPLSGAFGSGAGFALEDAYVLGRAIGWAAREGRPLEEALGLLDAVRSPHYARLYATLDGFSRAEAGIAAREPRLDATAEIEERIRAKWGADSVWMHNYRVDQVLDDALRHKKRQQHHI